MTTLSTSLTADFEEQGYAVVESLIDPEEIIRPLFEEFGEVLDRLAIQLHRRGEIASTYDHLAFGERLTAVYRDSGREHNQFFDFSLPLSAITRDTPFSAGPAVFGALVYEPILDVVEQLIGPEIFSSPIQHVRIKPPEKFQPRNDLGQPVFGPTVWHQDLGVATKQADGSSMVTVWFALEDVPVDKGPLRLIPGSHRTGLLTHCRDYEGNGPEYKVPYVQIPERLFAADQQTPVPTKQGDVVLLHQLTVHGSLPNLSDSCRVSLDLRYNRIGERTGRDIYPGFVARSRANPESEFRDAARWNEMWNECRDSLAKESEAGTFSYSYSRWADGHPDCEV